MILSNVVSFVFFIVLKEISCLKDVVLDIEPRVVEYGKESTLRCSYDMKQNEQLYTVKWYRGQFEFYRFTPKELPNTKIFHIDGLDVDESRSDEHQVVLRNIGFNLSGNFSCEVTTENPFAAVTVYKDMLVVVLPKSHPSLTTDKSFYEVGDVLRANCSSPQSRPAATLTFILNNIVVCEKCITEKYPINGELFGTKSFLELPLSSSHYHNGRLTLKCVAQIGDLYQQDTEITFTSVKDPVPARVTQTSSSASIRRHAINCYLLLVIISFCYLK